MTTKNARFCNVSVLLVPTSYGCSRLMTVTLNEIEQIKSINKFTQRDLNPCKNHNPDSIWPGGFKKPSLKVVKALFNKIPTLFNFTSIMAPSVRKHYMKMIESDKKLKELYAVKYLENLTQ